MHPPSIVLCRIGSCVVAASLALATVHGAAAQDNWPQFRGLRAGVIDDDPRLPDQWSATENIAWKVDVPGFGWGSPIVWGEHIFVTAVIFALSEDGNTFVIQAGPEFKVVGKNSLDEMTLATPAVVRGSLIVRTASSLYRIHKAPPGKS